MVEWHTKGTRNMPRLVPLNEVANYSDGEILPMVRGKLTKLYEGKTKTGRYGDYILQNGEITGEGVTIPLFMMLENEIPQSWKGREVSITAHDGDKGLAGIEASDNEYKGKTTRQIKITGKAEFALVSGSGGGEQRREEPRQEERRQETRQPAQDNRPADHGHRTEPGSPFDINEVKKGLTQCANLMLLASIAVERVVVKGYKDTTGKDLDEQRKSAMATSLYISAERKGQNTLMPTKPLDFAKQPSPPPRPQPQPDVPPEPGNDDIPF